MLTEICANIRNYFTYDEDKHLGTFAIVDGAITPSIPILTDYIRIVGSRKNDGVHKVSDSDLIDESEFKGAIWIMSIPNDFLELVKEIEDWQAKYGTADSQAMNPFTSESFGGYSYSKDSGSSADSAGNGGWMSAYNVRLNPYRKARIV